MKTYSSSDLATSETVNNIIGCLQTEYMILGLMTDDQTNRCHPFSGGTEDLQKEIDMATDVMTHIRFTVQELERLRDVMAIREWKEEKHKNEEQ